MHAVRLAVCAVLVSLVVMVASASVVTSDLAGEFHADASLPARDFAWSPDGKRFAYSTAEGLWIGESSAPAHARLVVRTPSYPVDQIRWTPDGTRLAFVAGRPGDHWETIWVADSEGRQVRDALPLGSPVAATGIRSIALAGWDDGRRLVLSVHCGTSCLEFVALDLESGKTSRLCYGSAFASWRDGSSRGAYTNAWHGVTRIVERVPGADSEPMADCRTVFPRPEDDSRRVARAFDDWSLDGTAFVYTAWTPARADESEVGGVGVGSPTLAVYDMASSTRRVVAHQTAWGAWSPDGTRIAATRLVPAKDGSDELVGTLVILDARTGADLASAPVGQASRAAWVRVGDTPRLAPSWSPDGTVVVTQNAARALVGIDASSGRTLTITHSPARALWARGFDLRLAITMLDDRGGDTPSVERHGLDRYLPPHGTADGASPAARIERYYGFLHAGREEAHARREEAHARSEEAPHEDGLVRWFMADYAHALWALGRIDAAETWFRRALAESDPGVDRDDRRGQLAMFLRCTGRQDEARRIAPPPQPSPVPPDGRETLGGRMLSPEEIARLPKDEDPCDLFDPRRPPRVENAPEPPRTYIVAWPGDRPRGTHRDRAKHQARMPPHDR